MTTSREWKKPATLVMRWSARVLGLIIVGFGLLMFIGQSLQSGPPGKDTEPACQGLHRCDAHAGIHVLSCDVTEKIGVSEAVRVSDAIHQPPRGQ